MGTDTSDFRYEAFQEKRNEMATLLNDASSVISQLSMEQYQHNLKDLSNKVYNDTFKIQVVGTFKNGKSTFINSFLGEEILPAYALPCTAVINEVKYGKEKKAVLYFRDPLPDKLPEEISERAKRYMEKYHMEHVPPLEIPYTEIEDYVVIPMGKDFKEADMESPYEKVELFWPLPLLEKGVEIIDSPGLNEHATRTKVTMEYLTKADAIVFILNAQAICAADEMHFIERYLKQQGFNDPFFIVNRFDYITSPKVQAQMKLYAQNKLRDYTSNEIFFVSALNALDAKMDHDMDKLAQSGMADFEARLSEFLTKQRGNAKLSQPARELKRILDEEALFKIIPMQRDMLRLSLDDLKKRYEEAKPKLANLKIRKDQLSSKLLLKIEQTKPAFRRMASNNSTDLSHEVVSWINDYTPAAKLGAIPSKKKANAVVDEISEFVSGKIEEQQLDWRSNVLMPLIEEKVTDIFGSVEEDLGKLFSDIDKITVDIIGKPYDTKPVPTWQRVAGIVGGLAIGDIGLAMSGGINGLSKDLAKTFALEFGAGLVLAFFSLLNPVTIIAVIISAILMSWKNGESKAMQTLKSSMIDEITKQLNDSTGDGALAFADEIGNTLQKMANQIVEALDVEIHETEQQVEGIIADLQKGQETIHAKEETLTQCEGALQKLSTELGSFIFNLIN